MGNVLIIEDDKNIAETLCMVLEAEGFTAKIAPTLLAAKNVIEKERPDLILLDYVLPDGPPEDFVKYVRKIQDATPIVLVTAASQPEALAEALQIKKLIKKPFPIEDLLSTVREFHRNS